MPQFFDARVVLGDPRGWILAVRFVAKFESGSLLALFSLLAPRPRVNESRLCIPVERLRAFDPGARLLHQATDIAFCGHRADFVARRLQADLQAMEVAARSATKPIAAVAAMIAVYIRLTPPPAFTADRSYRVGIVRALEDRIKAARTTRRPDMAAVAVYGLVNAVLVIQGVGEPGLGKDASALVLLALSTIGVAPYREAAGFAAAGCTLAEVISSSSRAAPSSAR